MQIRSLMLIGPSLLAVACLLGCRGTRALGGRASAGLHREVRCKHGPRLDSILGYPAEVRAACDRIASVISSDDREAWLELTSAGVAFPGGRARLEARLKVEPVADILELPVGRAIDLVIVRDCSTCRRPLVTFGFQSDSPWILVVEAGRKIVYVGPKS